MVPWDHAQSRIGFIFWGQFSEGGTLQSQKAVTESVLANELKSKSEGRRKGQERRIISSLKYLKVCPPEERLALVCQKLADFAAAQRTFQQVVLSHQQLP